MTLIQTVAKKTKYSESHVSNVLAGRRNNSTIVKVAKAVKQEMKSKTKKRK